MKKTEADFKYNDFLKSQVLAKFQKPYSEMNNREKSICRLFLVRLKRSFPKFNDA